MKKLLFLIFLLGIVLPTLAQDSPFGGDESGNIKNPLVWEGKIKKLSDSDYELSITGFIDEKWHVYSQHTPNENIGPLPLEMTFRNADTDFTLVGSLGESETHRTFSDVWGFMRFILRILLY